MNINKYTEKAQEVVLAAQQLAEQMSHAQVEPEHLLVALVEQRGGIVPEVLRKMAAEPSQVATGARELLTKIPSAYGGAQPGLSPRLKLVTDEIDQAVVQAHHLQVGQDEFLRLAEERYLDFAARRLRADKDHK